METAFAQQPIILASGSPRRQESFRLLGLPFICFPANVDETPPPDMSPRHVAEHLAVRKVMAVADKLGMRNKELETEDCISLVDQVTAHGLQTTAQFLSPHSSFLIFGADTIVVLENEIFGKPLNRSEAGKMLNRLAGCRHEVITAMALHNRETGKTDSRSASCEVFFGPLAEAEIEWYLNTGEWEGAAGAYRLQERGACLISSINGSPGAVVGLPLRDFFVMLKDNGYQCGA